MELREEIPPKEGPLILTVDKIIYGVNNIMRIRTQVIIDNRVSQSVARKDNCLYFKLPYIGPFSISNATYN